MMKGRGARGQTSDDGSSSALTSEAERAYQRYKQEYTLLPTQKLFKIERLTEYDRDELLKKMELDKLLHERKMSMNESSLQNSQNSGHHVLLNDPINHMMGVSQE